MWRKGLQCLIVVILQILKIFIYFISYNSFLTYVKYRFIIFTYMTINIPNKISFILDQIDYGMYKYLSQDLIIHNKNFNLFNFKIYIY